jgi:hypothetical protein
MNEPLGEADVASNETKANLVAAGVGCGLPLLGGVIGTALGFALMPSGGYYGTILDAAWTFLLCSGTGFVIGIVVAALLRGRVSDWIRRQ